MTVPRRTSIDHPAPNSGLWPVLRDDNGDKIEHGVAKALTVDGRNTLLDTLRREGETCVMLLRERDVLEMSTKTRDGVKSGKWGHKEIHTRALFPSDSLQQYGEVRQGFFFFGTDYKAIQQLSAKVKDIMDRWPDGGFAFVASQFYPVGP